MREKGEVVNWQSTVQYRIWRINIWTYLKGTGHGVPSQTIFEKLKSQGQLWTVLLKVPGVILYSYFEKCTNGGRKMNPGVKLTPLGRGEAQIRMSALGLFCKREKHIPMYRSKHLGIGKFLLSAQLKYFSPRLQKKKYFM